MPFLFRYLLDGYEIEVDAASLQRLKSLKNERCLLLPNHPTQWDPWAMAGLGRCLNEFFYYVAAREVFDWNFKIRGWLLQNLGTYSIVRGGRDKESFKMTREILSQNRGRLVIFVEGEISNQNDSLLPLEPGVIHLAFLALHDLYRQVHKDITQLPSLYVCPVAMKYFYEPKGLETTIERSILGLEKATGLDGTGKSNYERVRNLSLTVLKESSKQFGYPLSFEDSLDEQIKQLENFVLTKLEQVVNLPYTSELGYLDRVRRIRNTVDRVVKESEEEETFYQKRLHHHQKEVLKNFYWDLDRIVNFIAVYDGYIYSGMTPERYVEVIRRLEREVFGWPRLSHPSTAVIQVLNPIDLKERFEAFLHDKKSVTEEIIGEIEPALYVGITSAQLQESPPQR